MDTYVICLLIVLSAFSVWKLKTGQQWRVVAESVEKCGDWGAGGRGGPCGESVKKTGSAHLPSWPHLTNRVLCVPLCV